MRADLLAAAAVTRRQIARGPLVLRGIIAIAAAVAVVATTMPSWDAPDGYVAVAVLAAMGYVVAPDTGNGGVFVAAVVVTWLTGAPGDVSPAVVITALALLVGHVAAALAAAVPITSRVGIALGAHWWRATAAIAGGVLAAAVLVAGLDRWSPPSSPLLTLAAIAAVTAGAWWWSDERD